MIKLKYKNWSDISIKKFDEISDILSHINNVNDEEALEININLLSILCDVSVEEIEDLPLTEFSKLVKQTEFLKEMPKVDIKDSYVINGKKYVLCANVSKMTTAQYIDYQTLIKNADKNVKELLSVFLIPKGKKYGEYDLEEVMSDIYNYFPIADARAVSFFFTLVLQSLTKATLISLERRTKKELKKAKTKVEKEKIEILLGTIRLSKDSIPNGIGHIL